MLRFLSRNKRFLSLLLLLAATLTLFARDIRGSRSNSFFDRILLVLATPPLKLTTSIFNSAGRLWRRYVALINAERENEHLRSQRDMLLVENQLLKEQARENERLRELLTFKQRNSFRMIPAEIIGRDPTSWFKSIIIDKGAHDGVVQGAGVITPEGVVGRIIKVAPSSAHVLLLIDVNSNIDAVVQRSRARGIVVGTGENLCRLAYVQKTEDIQEGDQVITSGLGGIFPSGMLIGSVITLHSNKGGFFQHIELQPAVDFSRLHEVFVVLSDRVAQ